MVHINKSASDAAANILIVISISSSFQLDALIFLFLGVFFSFSLCNGLVLYIVLPVYDVKHVFHNLCQIRDKFIKINEKELKLLYFKYVHHLIIFQKGF